MMSALIVTLAAALVAAVGYVRADRRRMKRLRAVALDRLGIHQ